jgi:RecA-family ATPase
MLENQATLITGEEEVFQGDALLQIKSGNRWYNIAHEGHVVYLAGLAGTMKSTILRYIAASGGGQTTPLGFKLNTNGKLVRWFDGEQPIDIVVDSINQIKDLSGICDGGEYLDMYSLNNITTPIKRRSELWRLLYDKENAESHNDFGPKAYNTGLIIIDGADNFMDNLNDVKESITFINNLKTTAQRMRCIVIILSHTTQGFVGNQTKLYGVFGTKLKNYASCGFDMERRGKFFGMKQTKARMRQQEEGIGTTIAPQWFTYGKYTNTLVPEPYMPI